MSIVRTTGVRCDDCGEVYETTYTTAREARLQAAGEGWTRNGNTDRCPECASVHRKGWHDREELECPNCGQNVHRENDDCLNECRKRGYVR